jgi:hypothetical protein
MPYRDHKSGEVPAMTRRISQYLKLTIISFLLMNICWVSCSGNSLKFSPETLPGASLYQQYEATITISGQKTPVGYIGISAGVLPDGIKLTYEQGNDFATLSGDPTLLGTFSFTLNTWCEGTNRAGQSAQHSYEITVTRD